MGWFSDMLETVGGWFNDLSGASDAYENSMKSWNLQNEYNSPAAQIERFKSAGIDVNPLVYAVGNGSMSSGNATGAPSKSGSGVNPLTTVMEMMSGISNMKTQAKQREAVDVQNKQTEATTENTFANTARIQAESKNLVEDAKIKRETARQMKWENDFMERWGYRPISPDWKYHFARDFLSPDGTGKGGAYEFSDNPEEWKSKIILKDKTKPALGSNVLSVPEGWSPKFWK